MRPNDTAYVIATNETFIEEVTYLKRLGGMFVVRTSVGATVRVADVWPTFAAAERELWHRLRRRRHALERERTELSARIGRFIVQGVPLKRSP